MIQCTTWNFTLRTTSILEGNLVKLQWNQ